MDNKSAMDFALGLARALGIPTDKCRAFELRVEVGQPVTVKAELYVDEVVPGEAETVLRAYRFDPVAVESLDVNA